MNVLIAGQGIAGTALALAIEAVGGKFCIIDAGEVPAASSTAGGLINPVTGRYYTQSWMIETLMPFAHQFYSRIQQQIQKNIFTETRILRIHEGSMGTERAAKALNMGKSGSFMKPALPEDFKIWHIPAQQGVWIDPVYHVQLHLLCRHFREQWLAEGKMRTESLHSRDLSATSNGWVWKNTHFDHIVDARGFSSQQSDPWFPTFPMRPAKGEALIVEIEDWKFPYILHHHLFLIPLGDSLFWVGSNFDQNFTHLNTNPDLARQWIEQVAILCGKRPRLISHTAAARPCMSDRRPLIWLHPQASRMWLFNGMGTKGASLAPYFAHQLVKHWTQGSPLMHEVDGQRFSVR